MKKTIKPCVLFILFFVHISSTVQASFVSSAAELDIDRISFTSLSGDATLEMQNTSNQALVNTNGENADMTSSSDAFATTTSSGELAKAGSSPNELFASTEVDLDGNAEAFSEYSVDYRVQGSGVVKVTIGYNFFIESNDASNHDSELFTSSSLFDRETNSFDEASLSVGAGDDLSLVIPGELEILLILNDGDIGTLVFNTHSFADVDMTRASEIPLPPTLFLFISGLVGFITIRRK